VADVSASLRQGPGLRPPVLRAPLWHVYICIHIHACMHGIHIHYIHACIHTYIHTYIHIHIHIHIYTYTYVYIYTYMYMYIRTYVCITRHLPPHHRQAIFLCAFRSIVLAAAPPQRTSINARARAVDARAMVSSCTHASTRTRPCARGGQLVGGLDIIKELIENGELKEALGLDGSEDEPLNARLEKLINREVCA